MCDVILGDKAFVSLQSHNNAIGHRLRLLSDIVEGRVTQVQMSLDDATVFHEILLDATGLQCATGVGGVGRGVFDSLHLGDPSTLGTARNRRAELKKGTNSWQIGIFSC